MDEPVLDVYTIDRYRADLYPLEMNTRPEGVTRFGRFFGGSSVNVAVVATRMGYFVACVTRVSDDPFGRFVRPELTRLGVGTRRVVVNPTFNTPVTSCRVLPPDNFPLLLYRQSIAPDLETGVGGLPSEVATACILWLAISDLSVEPSWSANHKALRHHHSNSMSILNFDYRACFWPSEQETTAQVRQALEHVNVAIGNLEECWIAVDETDPDTTAFVLLERGVEVAVVKQGMMGTLMRVVTEWVCMPIMGVRVRDGLGVGGGFDGAVCYGLLQGWDLARTLAFVSVTGAIVASRLECSTATPRVDEMEHLMAANPQVVPVVDRIRH